MDNLGKITAFGKGISYVCPQDLERACYHTLSTIC
jgi:hypothetical protein